MLARPWICIHLQHVLQARPHNTRLSVSLLTNRDSDMRKYMLAAWIVFTTCGLVAADGVTPAVALAPVQQCYTALPIDQAVVPVMYPATSEQLPPPSIGAPPLDGAAPVFDSGSATDVIIPPAVYPSSAWPPRTSAESRTTCSL